MSTVAPAPSANSTNSASSTSGSRNGLKAPSNLLHGSQANFAALLFQADEAPEDLATAQWVTDTTKTTSGDVVDDKTPGTSALTPSDPQAFMNWIGLQTGQAAVPAPNAASASANASSAGPGSPALPIAANQPAVPLVNDVATPDATASLKPSESSLGLVAPRIEGTPLNAPISIADFSNKSSDEGLFNTEKSLSPLSSDAAPTTTPKVRLNGVRVNGATVGALANAPTSTLRLAAQHQVGMAASAPTATTPNGQPGLAAVSPQDVDRQTNSRASGGFDFLAEAPRSEGLSVGDASAGTSGKEAGANPESGSGASGHGDNPLAWGVTAPEHMHPTGETGASEAATSAFQGQMDEIAQQMGQWFAQGTQSASLTLDGDGATPLDIEVTLEKGKVSIRFGADEESAREALMSHIEATLKPMLEQHGMSLADVQITPSTGQDALAQHMAQSQHGNGSSQQNPQTRPDTLPSQPRVTATATSAASALQAPSAARQPQGAVDLFA